MCFLQKRIEGLKKERKTVEDQMTMAEDELQKTEDLVKMLSDSKTVRSTNCNLRVLYLQTFTFYALHCETKHFDKP